MCKPWEQPKQISPDKFEEYLNDGWVFGKLIYIKEQAYKWDKSKQTWIQK